MSAAESTRRESAGRLVETEKLTIGDAGRDAAAPEAIMSSKHLVGVVVRMLGTLIRSPWFAIAATAALSAGTGLAQVQSLGLPVETSAGCGGCPIPIERLMREFQARKDATGSERSKWPEAECGEQKIPAPPYPPDGFYGNMLCDPRLMTALVDAVNFQMRAYDRYSEYLIASSGQIPNLDGEEYVPISWRHSYGDLFGPIDSELGYNPIRQSLCLRRSRYRV